MVLSFWSYSSLVSESALSFCLVEEVNEIRMDHRAAQRRKAQSVPEEEAQRSADDVQNVCDEDDGPCQVEEITETQLQEEKQMRQALAFVQRTRSEYDPDDPEEEAREQRMQVLSERVKLLTQVNKTLYTFVRELIQLSTLRPLSS